MEQLANFRATYPHCTLVSELVGVEHGQYIVRYRVDQAGHCVVASLSAATTVEAAEEQARDRALALLAQIGVPPIQIPAPPVTAIAPPVATVPPIAAPPSAIAPPTTAAPQPDPEPISAPVVAPSPSQPAPPEQPSIAVSNGQGIPEPSPEPTAVEPPSPKPLPEAPPRPPASQPKVMPNGTIDFTDIIARTNLEMKRLGWTNEQGRQYLLQTYGKRSRQRLDDQELQEFLAYLESQP